MKTFKFHNFPRIADFPNDERIWCVQYFGEIGRKTRKRSEAFIKTVITPTTIKNSTSPLRIDSKEENYPFIKLPDKLTIKNSFDHEHTKIIDVGVSSLPLINIGSLWIKGKKILLDKKTSEQKIYFEKLYTHKTIKATITQDKTKIVTAKDTYLDPNKKNTYYIPKSYYNLIPENKTIHKDWLSPQKSKYLAISSENITQNKDSADISTILIPCIEIIRYYYINSSRLSRALFNGALQDREHNTLFKINDDTFFDKTKKYGSVSLCQGISNKDARHVARLAFFEYAYKQAENIYLSSIKTTTPIPECYPPFEGETTLNLFGKKIKSEDSWHYIVYKILDCSQDYFMEKFQYIPAGDNSGEKNHEGEKTAFPGNPGRQPKHPKDKKEVVTTEEPANDKSKTMANVIKPEEESPSLYKVEAEKKPKEECATQSGEKPSTEEDGKNYSMGDGTYGESDCSSLEFDQSKQQDTPPKQKAEVVDIFAEFKEDLEKLKLQNELPNLFLEYQNIDLIWETKGGREILHKALKVTISWKNKFIYLYELGKKKNYRVLLFHHINLTFIDDGSDIIERLEARCAEKEGRWSKTIDFPDYQKKLLNHGNGLMNRIIKYLKGAVPNE